jgi:SAM-dependent methyltransferase
VFSDADDAELYDLLNPWDPSLWPGDRFYHQMVMAASSVLDVGCGTGAMLAYARDHGHKGRLAGLDPDRAALDRARRRADIEWTEVESVDKDLVTFTETTAEPDGTVLRAGRAALRFLDPPALSTFLDAADFQIEAQYGDWDGTPITSASREIITVARTGVSRFEVRDDGCGPRAGS